MIVDYGYYSGTFAGDLVPANKFRRNSIKAQQMVMIYILGKNYNEYKEEVKNTICEVAEIYYNQELKKEKIKNIFVGDSKIITSETVGKHSISYSGISIEELKKTSSDEFVNSEIKDVVERNLLLTGLLNRAVSNV